MNNDIEQFAPNEFPYDVENELGRVLRAEQMCPGVYDVAVTQEGSRVPREIFLVCRDAAAISGTVKARGVPLRRGYFLYGRKRTRFQKPFLLSRQKKWFLESKEKALVPYWCCLRLYPAQR